MPKTFALQNGHDESGLVQKAVLNLFNDVALGSLATVNLDLSPHINTCYVANDKNWNIYFLSSPKSSHAKNLVRNAACALTLFDSEQKFGTELRGLQLFGTAKQLSLAESVHAFSIYSKRFPDLLRWTSDVQSMFKHLEDRFFEFAVTSGKMLNEPNFGKEVYIDFTLTE